MLKRIRTTLAVLFYALTTLLLLDFSGALHTWLGWLAKIQFVPALIGLHVAVIMLLLILTLLFGRVYCSVICPLGVMQDGVSRLGTWGKRFPYGFRKPLNYLRYSVLAVFAVGVVVVALHPVVSLLDPYSIYGRVVNTLLQPLYILCNNGLAALAERADSYLFYSVDVWMRSLPTLIVAAVSLIVVVAFAWRGGRDYCNSVCPVGSALGLISRFSIFKMRFDHDKCNGCGLCERSCKGHCIDAKSGEIDYSRCVACGNCESVCKKGALKYSAKAPVATSQKAKSDNSRRDFVTAISLLAASSVQAQKMKVDGGLAVILDKQAPERKQPITPAGSLSASNMAAHCTACQLCVSACPNQVLIPSSNLATFMQPYMSYERGYCRPECTTCSEVCPAGAINPISREDKSSTQIGRAVWVRKNCVVITDDVECGNCARHCPVGAITMVPDAGGKQKGKGHGKGKGGKRLIPVVNHERCIGCGACENLCPSRPFSAIYVEGNDQHREV